MTQIWTKWEGHVINGVFPLRRLLTDSDHSAVFLTEHKASNRPSAAIKLIPADPATTELQLAQWRTAATVSHPHLIRLLNAGRCRLNGDPFVFVVMEYAEETLAQILPHRALTPDEVREMLRPTLSALAFLHRQNLVQGSLKPTNVLVVNDQVKLASDTILPVGESAQTPGKPSPYDPPEATSGKTPAGDIWSLGMTVAEALTQTRPNWSDESPARPSITTSLPPTFADMVQRCLNRNPASRPTVAQLNAEINPTPKSPAIVVSPPALPGSPGSPALPTTTAASPASGPSVASVQVDSPRWVVPAVVIILVVLAGGWVGLRRHQSHSDSPQTIIDRSASSSETVPAASALPPQLPRSASPAISVAPVTSSPTTTTNTPQSKALSARSASRSSGRAPTQIAGASAGVVHEEIPRVAHSARDTIRGQIKVAVRVSVDRSGRVTDESLEIPGSSRYFARLATDAARKWRFAPADTPDTREWLVWFEYSRDGTAGHAVIARP